jgi:hypothetical protein
MASRVRNPDGRDEKFIRPENDVLPKVLRQTLTNFGIPQALYPDRHSVFFVNSKKEENCFMPIS